MMIMIDNNINNDDNKLKNAILSVKNKSEVDPDL